MRVLLLSFASLLLLQFSSYDKPLVVPHEGRNTSNVVHSERFAERHWSPLTINMRSWEAKVYNRHGELMYEAHNEPVEWDGTTLSGEIAPIGWYVYSFTGQDRQGEEVDIIGRLILIRCQNRKTHIHNPIF